MNQQNHNQHDHATDFPADDNSTLPASYDAPQGAAIDGTHPARFVRWHWDTAKSGDINLAAMLRIVGGPFDGKQVPGNLYFDTDRTDKNGRTAADRSTETLRAAGLVGDLDSIGDDVGGLDANEVSIVVETKDGYPRAKYINPARSFTAFAPPPEDKKAAFFAQLKARAQGTAQAQRATGAAPVHGQPQRPPAQQQRPAAQSSGQQVQQRPAAQPAQGQQGQQRPASTATLHTPQGQGQQQRARGPQVAPQQPMGFGVDPCEDEIPF